MLSIIVTSLVAANNLGKRNDYFKFLEETYKLSGSDNFDIGYKDYDFYVYSIGWSDTYCRTHPSSDICYQHLNALSHKNILRIHGLWPSMRNGKLLPTCNTKTQIQINPTESEPFTTMSDVWASMGLSGNTGFWAHEYNKHGYCYNQRNGVDVNDYDVFFQKALDIYNKENFIDIAPKVIEGKESTIVGDEERTTFTIQELTDKITKIQGTRYFEFECLKKGKDQLLSEVRFYFDLNFNRINNLKYHSTCDDSSPLVVYFEKEGTN